MKHYRSFLLTAFVLSLVLSGSAATTVQAGNPFKLGIPLPFKRIEADPKKDYRLTDQEGPWLILVASFVGDSGEQQARDLVLELRREYKLTAFVYHKKFDFSEEIQGKGWVLDKNKQLAMQRMRNLNTDQFEEIAVMVGNYATVDDKGAQKTLEKIKYMWPKTLRVSETVKTSQRMAIVREIQRRMHPDANRKKQGQMSGAFITPNPMIPEEYFNPNGPDKFILDLNREIENGLLTCRGKYTVCVATFGGESSLNLTREEETESLSRLDKILGRKVESKLALAANNAHTLAVALRKKGIEAYEYHDREKSIVCVGSHEWVSRRSAVNGAEEPNEAIYKTIQKYGGVRSTLPGLAAGRIQSKSLKEHPKLLFDITPLPMEVPRYSVAASFRNR